MINARFVKATPTKEGITYTLQGERNKQALHAAAELQDEAVCISKDTPEPDNEVTLESMDDLANQIFALANKMARQYRLAFGEIPSLSQEGEQGNE